MTGELVTATSRSASDENNASECLPPLVNISTLSKEKADQHLNSEILFSSTLSAKATFNAPHPSSSNLSLKTNVETAKVVSTFPPVTTQSPAKHSPSPIHSQENVKAAPDKTSTADLPSHDGEANPSRALLQIYPAPLASHEDVIMDSKLFIETLHKFHCTLGSKITIPKIGGCALDLHLLYREVTTRGGLQQVIRNRIWKEIKAVFNFPRTATNASFVLRKYYTTLLHHYEQVYFLGAQGPLVLPPASLPSPSPQSTTSLLGNGTGSHNSTEHTKRRKRRLATLAEDIDPTACIGQCVTGAIDGKFENGYLVTVKVGSENLRGVMYSVPHHNQPQFAMLPVFKHGVYQEPYAGGLDGHLRRKRRRKSHLFVKDPNAPKSNRSGYNFFFAEQRAKLKHLHPDKDREISRMIGDLWNKLTDEEKLPYQEQGQKDKERYKKEVIAYKGKLHARTENVNENAGHDVLVTAEGQPASKSDSQDDSGHEDDFHVSYNTCSAEDLTSGHDGPKMKAPNLDSSFPVTIPAHEARLQIHELGAYG